MSIPAHLDFATEPRQGTPRLLIEAKRISRAEPRWATAWRSNLLRMQPEGLAESSMVLVTLERIFVWPANAGSDVPPRFALETRKHLRPYLERVRQLPEAMTSRGFERIVSWWLKDLTDAQYVADLTPELRTELTSTGLLAALAGAHLVQEVSSS